ncbi:MAG TPA: hypothetical protein PKA64_24190 [Myxococcota bacterium]|nr:hypothetical protein [Myxococcota bacterium]
MPEPAHSPHDASGLPPAHDRTPEARERLQGQLRASYGVRTAEEELRLERVVDLTWRLQGAARALDAQATLQHLHAERKAPSLPTATDAQEGAVLDTWDTRRLRLGLSRVDSLVADLPAPSMRPTPQDIRSALDHLVGSDRMLFGLDGCQPLRELSDWEEWLEVLAEEEAEVGLGAGPAPVDEDAPVRPPHTWTEELGKLRQRLEARLAEAEAREGTRARARVDAHGVPYHDELPVVARYERDLARQLEQATAALRAAVGRRRLGEIGRAWLRGR